MLKTPYMPILFEEIEEEEIQKLPLRNYKPDFEEEYIESTEEE